MIPPLALEENYFLAEHIDLLVRMQSQVRDIGMQIDLLEQARKKGRDDAR
jgi:hypothetical protein